MQKILFIDSNHPVLENELREAGFQCDLHYGESYEAHLERIPEYIGIVIRSGIKIDARMIDAGSKLKFIARVGAGLENIDTEYAKSKGIACYNSPEGNRDAVGEHALGMLLMQMNHLKRVDAEVRKGIWLRAENRGSEIGGRTVGIIGYGNMGSTFAKKISGIGAKVIAYDKYKNNYGDAYANEASMEQLFEECDIVSLHVPLTEETKYLCNEEWIGKFKKPIWLINTARGPVVKTKALIDAIEGNTVIGACLDVLEFEKFSFEKLSFDEIPEELQYLIQSDKVLLSPHIAGWTHESHYKLAKVIVDKILNNQN
jgi:D-3-phosphoglycerate dehydrogenase